MTEEENGSSIIDAWLDDPLAAGVAAALGAVAGAAVASAFTSSTTKAGDEPPIRVRHGSIRVQLLDRKKARKFDKHNGNPKKWKIHPPAARGKDPYLVVVLPDDFSKVAVATGYLVEVFYSNGQRVYFESQNKKTFVHGDSDLKQYSDQELDYGEFGGWIQKVLVDGKKLYESGMVDPELQIVLLDA